MDNDCKPCAAARTVPERYIATRIGKAPSGSERPEPGPGAVRIPVAVCVPQGRGSILDRSGRSSSNGARLDSPGVDLSGPPSEAPRVKSHRPQARSALLIGLGLGFAVLLWGGYSDHWKWTGINGGTATLWDWLHLLLLPVVFAVLPTWVRADTRMDPRIKRCGLVALVLASLLVAAGYLIPWAWTGFRGNTLWDWLSLVVLPVAILLTPRVAEIRHHWKRSHALTAGTALVGLVAFVLGGYLGGWAWTGFTGNTLWDWLHLLLLPLLLPTVVAPALTPLMLGRIAYLDENGRPVTPPQADDARDQSASANAGADGERLAATASPSPG